MIYFKKNLLKKIILLIYIFFNSSNIFLNKLFGFFKFKNKIRVYYGGSLKGSLGGTLVKIKRLNEVFQNNNINFNVVYLLSNSIYLNKFSLSALKRSKIPIIHNQNGVFYKGWYGEGWEEKNNQMSFQYHLADYVFYQSNFSKYCSQKFLGKREGPSEILYNAVDNNFFSPNKKKILNSELKILVTGKYQQHLYYSLEFIMNTLNQLNKNKIQASINFAGYYDPVIIKKIFNLARIYNLHDKIKFSGIYKQDEANFIYNSADIYFYFVHQSNCPNSVIEAMSCGLPILSTNSGGLNEIVGKESGVCLDTEQSWNQPFVPNLNDALNGVIKIINNYSDYSNNSINKVAKDHNINNWIKKHEEIFNRFI
jgi:glycosyltransferase involved in cell wall biosynthesis